MRIFILGRLKWDIILVSLIEGNGLGMSAVKQVCSYIFENTDIIRIFAEPFAYNKASCRVLEKAGFQFEGLLRNNAIKNGKVLDMRMYSLFKN